MTEIHHRPIFNTKEIEQLYSQKDGVPVKYVCTSSANMGTVAYDIFYRETPHPEFGNKYFGLYINQGNQVMITNADTIEDLDFGMLEVDGKLYYSQHRWDYYAVNENIAIDGGRAYVKLVGDISNAKIRDFSVKDGEFIEKEV